MKQTAFVVLLLMLWASAVFGTSKAYDIVPYKGCVSQAPAYVNVSQYYRNTLDSITMISFWMGDRGNGEAFNVEVRDSAGPRVAHKDNYPAPSRSWSWLNVPLDFDAHPVRGRTYRVTITRQFGAAISFAYDPTNPYKHGHAVANGSSMPDGSGLGV